MSGRRHGGGWWEEQPEEKPTPPTLELSSRASSNFVLCLELWIGEFCDLFCIVVLHWNERNWLREREEKIALFSRALLLKEWLYFSLCDVGCLSVRPWQDPPPTPSRKCDFWTAQAILSNFHFHFSPPKKIFPLSLFYAFLDVSCHPGWRKARHNATKHF